MKNVVANKTNIREKMESSVFSVKKMLEEQENKEQMGQVETNKVVELNTNILISIITLM